MITGLAVAAAHLDRDPRVAVPAAQVVELLGVLVGVELRVNSATIAIEERSIDVGRGVVEPAAGRDVGADRVGSCVWSGFA
jgi:hypothetical protein